MYGGFMKNKNILSKIFYIFLAILILGIGYLIGTVILVTIFAIIILMTLLFIISWIFSKIIRIFKTETAKLGFKMIFSSIITIAFLLLGWLFFSKWLLSLESSLAITIIWVMTCLIFGTMWYFLKVKKKTKTEYLWEYYKADHKLLLWDYLIMLLIPTLIVYVFNLIYGII